VEAAPVVTSVSQIDTLIAEVTSLRETTSKTLKGLVQLKKAVARELKEAGRRRRRQRKTTESTDGSVAPKRASMFTTPVGLKDSLADFLGKPKGAKMTPAEVSRAVTAYIKTHNLKDPAKGHTIHADGPLRKVLALKEGEELTYRTIQRYLYQLYNLPEKKSATTA
jgi:chromatin remodeling complex protein RSC6